MKSTFLTLKNLRELIKESLYSAEQSARTADNFLEIAAVEKILSQIKTDIILSEQRLADKQLELIDKHNVTIKAKEAEKQLKELVETWKS